MLIPPLHLGHIEQECRHNEEDPEIRTWRDQDRDLDDYSRGNASSPPGRSCPIGPIYPGEHFIVLRWALSPLSAQPLA